MVEVYRGGMRLNKAAYSIMGNAYFGSCFLCRSPMLLQPSARNVCTHCVDIARFLGV
jgi:hypothetical protein